MMKVVLARLKDDGVQTLGNLSVYEGTDLIWTCKTVELPWRNNNRNVSCIPTGVYKCDWSYSPKFKTNVFEVTGVPERSGIRIHVANYVRQLHGCIALGYCYKDIDNDGQMDIAMSRICLEAFQEIMYEQFTLTIV
jgi:hypothetical protein